MDLKLRILHLEDDPIDSALVGRILREDGLAPEIDRVKDVAGLKQALEHGDYALILSDFTLPGLNGLAALRWARQRRPEVPFVFVSGTIGEEAAVETLKHGATDYVLKHHLDRLASAVRRALEQAAERARRKQAEHALREREAALTKAVSIQTIGVIFFSLGGRITDANEALLRMTGYSREEFLAITDWHLLTPPEFHEVTLRAADQVATTGETPPYEKQWLRKDGSRFWGLFAPTRLSGAGPDSNCIEFIIDITKRKLAEAALREQVQLAQLRADATQALQQPLSLRDLMQSIAALLVERLDAAFVRIWLLDSTGQVLELQASAGLYTHLDGGHSRVPVGHLKAGHIAQQRQPLITNQVVGDPHVPNQDWARREKLVAFAGFPLLLEGRLLGVVALFARHTISQAATETFGAVAAALAQAVGRHQAEQALQAAKEALARANADLEQRIQERTAKLRETVAELEGFSYSLAHDLRAPLRAMTSYADILEREAGERSKPEHSDLLRRIKLAALRMDQLVTDSLNYSKILRQDLRLGPVNLGSLIRGLVETYPNLQPPAADITVEIAALIVHGNQAALVQVFSNLLGNAVKFVAPGVHPRVRVCAQFPQPAKVLIWVEDNGIGIPKDQQERIFGIFERAHHAEEYPGTGIGLAIVRKSLDRIGGQVCLDSEPGRGSRFCVQLSLAYPDHPALAA